MLLTFAYPKKSILIRRVECKIYSLYGPAKQAAHREPVGQVGSVMGLFFDSLRNHSFRSLMNTQLLKSNDHPSIA